MNRTCGDREPASDKQVSVRIRILSYVNKHIDVRDAFARGILSVFRSLFPSLRTRKLGTATPQPISTSINQGGRGEWSNPRLAILNNMKQPCTGRKDTKITQAVKHKALRRALRCVSGRTECGAAMLQLSTNKQDAHGFCLNNRKCQCDTGRHVETYG